MWIFWLLLCLAPIGVRLLDIPSNWSEALVRLRADIHTYIHTAYICCTYTCIRTYKHTYIHSLPVNQPYLMDYDYHFVWHDHLIAYHLHYKNDVKSVIRADVYFTLDLTSGATARFCHFWYCIWCLCVRYFYFCYWLILLVFHYWYYC